MMKMFVASFGACVVMAASCFAGTGTLNVKRCETSFMHHLQRMEQEGRTDELSPEFKTVVSGMKGRITEVPCIVRNDDVDRSFARGKQVCARQAMFTFSCDINMTGILSKRHHVFKMNGVGGNIPERDACTDAIFILLVISYRQLQLPAVCTACKLPFV